VNEDPSDLRIYHHALSTWSSGNYRQGDRRALANRSTIDNLAGGKAADEVRNPCRRACRKMGRRRNVSILVGESRRKKTSAGLSNRVLRKAQRVQQAKRKGCRGQMGRDRKGDVQKHKLPDKQTHLQRLKHDLILRPPLIRKLDAGQKNQRLPKPWGLVQEENIKRYWSSNRGHIAKKAGICNHITD